MSDQPNLFDDTPQGSVAVMPQGNLFDDVPPQGIQVSPTEDGFDTFTDPRTGLPHRIAHNPISALNAVKGAGLAAGGAYAGGILGTAVMPGVGTAIGAAGGGMLGNILHQETSPGYDVSKPYLGIKPGQVAATGLMTGIPMGNLQAASALQTLWQGGKLAALGITADQVEKAIDETRFLKPGEVASDATMGLLAAAGMKLVDSGTGAAAGKAAQAEWAANNPHLSKLAPELNDMGFTIPAHTTNPEGVAGATKFAGATGSKDTGMGTIDKLAAVKNQQQANQIAKKVIGVPDAAALTPDTFDLAIAQASEPYAKIAAISPQAAKDLQEMREAFSNGYKAKFAYDNPTPGHFDASLKSQSEGFYAEAEKKMASLEKQAKDAGIPDAVEALPEARVKLAQIGAVARSTNQVTGDLDMQALQRLRKQPEGFHDYAPPGEAKPRGDLAKLADAGKAFPQLFPSKVGKIPEVVAPTFKGGLVGGAIGLLAGHPEAGALAGIGLGKGVGMLKGAARNWVTSPEYILKNQFPPINPGLADPQATFLKNMLMSSQLQPDEKYLQPAQ